MAELDDFDPTDDNNTERWPENMRFSSVNDAGRADEGILARWWRDNNGSLAASGSSNAFTVTSNRTIAQLYNNLTLCFTANHTITGACTLNLNGIGAKSIKSPNGANLGSGAIVEGQPVYVVYKSDADAWLMLSAPAHMLGYATTSIAGVVELATAAEAKAASDASRPVTPAVQHQHPSAAKMWAVVRVTSGVPSLVKSYNVAGITDTASGILTVTIDRDFADANWCCIVNGLLDGGAPTNNGFLSRAQTAGSVTVERKSGVDGSNRTDPDKWFLVGYGDLAS